MVIDPSGSPASGSPAVTRQVQIFLISEGTGAVGCGDEVVGVNREIPATSAVLRGALDLLLNERSQYYGQSGLYNALYQSNLRVQSITRVGNVWTINLTGTLQLGGACDAPRVAEQLRQTAMQFATVRDVRFTINGVDLDTALSTR